MAFQQDFRVLRTSSVIREIVDEINEELSILLAHNKAQEAPHAPHQRIAALERKSQKEHLGGRELKAELEYSKEIREGAYHAGQGASQTGRHHRGPAGGVQDNGRNRSAPETGTKLNITAYDTDQTLKAWCGMVALRQS